MRILIFLLTLAFSIAQAKTVNVLIQDMKFTPAELSLAPGDTVVWENQDIVPHTATGLKNQFNSGDIPAGKSWKHTFKKKAELSYKCIYHPVMTGSLSVK